MESSTVCPYYSTRDTMTDIIMIGRKHMYSVDFHADDYAISLNNSKRMIELMESGRLNSFSIIANMGCYKECMDLLKEVWPALEHKPLISVHINLIDGFWLSSAQNEIIRNSWGKLFISSYLRSPARNQLKNDLTEEIKAQIKRVYDDTRELTDNDNNPVALRLDSHVHTHMIPIVFDAMIEALNQLNLRKEVMYVRNSVEPLKVFYTKKGIKGTCPTVNAIKNIILNILGKRVARKLKAYDIPTGMLWGLMMSGKMDSERVSTLLPDITKIASDKDLYLEILCHPGIVLSEETRPEYGPDDMEAFFSENRNIEYEMIKNRL